MSQSFILGQVLRCLVSQSFFLSCLMTMGITISQDLDCIVRNCVLHINRFILERVFCSQDFWSNFCSQDVVTVFCIYNFSRCELGRVFCSQGFWSNFCSQDLVTVFCSKDLNIHGLVNRCVLWRVFCSQDLNRCGRVFCSLNFFSIFCSQDLILHSHFWQA
jgi:hypothetical protein